MYFYWPCFIRVKLQELDYFAVKFVQVKNGLRVIFMIDDVFFFHFIFLFFLYYGMI